MDQMIIKTGFIKGIISRILSKTIKKKLGTDSLKIKIDDLNVDFGNGKGTFTVVLHGTFTQDDISKILSNTEFGE